MSTESKESPVELDEKPTPPARKPSKLANWLNRKILLSVLAGILMAVTTSWVNKKLDSIAEGPAAYYIYVVGGNKDSNGDNFMAEVYDAIYDAWSEPNERPTIGEKDVKIKYMADRWDPQQASEVSKEIAKQSDVLMVIGHFSSSTTREALQHYLAADPPIPVILTTETNPHLIPETYKENRRTLPVLRLWPTDDKQAEDIAKYATRTNHNKFWIVEDNRDNTIYSHYLAEKIIEEIQKHKKQVVLWTNNWHVPPVGTLRELNIESVFFPGSPKNALIFVNQIKALWDGENDPGSPPRIFLTDTAVSDIVHENSKELDGVYVTHPGLDACKSVKEQKGHVRLARDAARIALRIVSMANEDLTREWWRDFLEVQSVLDARKAMTKVINGRIKKNERFDALGHQQNAEFKLWQIRDGKFLAVADSKDDLVAVPCNIGSDSSSTVAQR